MQQGLNILELFPVVVVTTGENGAFRGKSSTNGQNPQNDLQNQGTTGKMGGKNQEVWRKFEHLIFFFVYLETLFIQWLFDKI